MSSRPHFAYGFGLSGASHLCMPRHTGLESYVCFLWRQSLRVGFWRGSEGCCMVHNQAPDLQKSLNFPGVACRTMVLTMVLDRLAPLICACRAAPGWNHMYASYGDNPYVSVSGEVKRTAAWCTTRRRTPENQGQGPFCLTTWVASAAPLEESSVCALRAFNLDSYRWYT